MTIWNYVGIWFGMAAYTVAWIWGGRAERFAAGFMIAFCLFSFITYKWVVGGLHVAVFIENCFRFLVFGWLCLRSDRWWPFVVTVAIALCVLVHAIAWLDPAVSETEAFSAQVGLGYLVDLTLLLSVLERWLAGEAPAGRAAWAAAETTARPKRRSPSGGLRLAGFRKLESGPSAEGIQPAPFPPDAVAHRGKGMTNRAPAC